MKQERMKHLGVSYYVPGRKRRITDSTKATSDFPAIVHQQYPTDSIQQLRDRICDRSVYIPNPDAIRVLDEHIHAGYGNQIPNWT